MTMQDPMSQMAMAQKLTITQLQQALRNGTIDPQVGQLVLNSKINEDKRRKSAMAAQTPQQPPVAQQNLAYGAGVDELPTNLPVAGMAGGGIISFDEGGEVKRFANEGLATAGFMPMTYAQYMALLPEAKQQYVNQFGAPPSRDGSKSPLQQSLGIKPPSLAERYVKEGTPLVPQAQPQRPIVPVVPQASTLTTEKGVLADTNAVDEKPAVNTRTISDYNVQSKGTPGIGGFSSKGYELKPYTDAEAEMKAQLAAEMNPKTGNPWTYEEKAAERKAQQESAGIKFDLFKDQQADLEKRKTKSDDRSRLDSAMPWFAAAEAFGRAPKPGEAAPTFLTAGANALGAYGRTRVDIDDKEELRQEKIRGEVNQLALAQNQFNLAQFSGNEAAVKEANNAIKSARSKLTDLGLKSVDQQNEMAKTVYEGNIKLQQTRMEQQGASGRLNKEYASIESLAKMIQDDAKAKGQTISNSEAMNKAYQMSKFQGSIYGADTGAVKAQIAALIKAKADSKEPLQTAAKAEWKKQQDAYDAQIAALNGGVLPTAGSTAAASDPYAGFSKIKS